MRAAATGLTGAAGGEEAPPDDLETVTGPVSQGKRRKAEWMDSLRRIMMLEIKMCNQDHTTSLVQGTMISFWSLYLSHETKVRRKEKRGEEGERREGRNTFLGGRALLLAGRQRRGGSQDSELAQIRRGDADLDQIPRGPGRVDAKVGIKWCSGIFK